MPLPDFARILRASQVRYGGFRVRGVPAILLGVSTVVAVAGTVRAVQATAPALPEALREATKLVRALRSDGGDQPQLKA